MALRIVGASFALGFLFVASCGDGGTGDVTALAPDASATEDANAGVNDSGSDAGSVSDASVGDASSDALLDAVEAGPSVQGRIVYNWFDGVIANATVTLGGTQTTTDADGKFTVANVTMPYDVTFDFVTNGIPMRETWRGLSAGQPVLESSINNQAAGNQTTVSGTVSGITSPIPADTAVRIWTRTSGGGISNVTRTAGEMPTFSLPTRWLAGASRIVTVHAFAYSPSGATYPTAFIGYGKTDVNATAGQTYANVDVAMTAPATKILSGTVNPPSSTAGLYTYVSFGATTSERRAMDWGTTASPSFSLAVPDIAGASYGVEIGRSYPNGGKGLASVFDPASQSFDLTEPPSPADLLTPAAGATFTGGMTFTWSGPAGVNGSYRFVLSRVAQIGPTYAEVTTATSVTLPASFAPTPGATYVWSVECVPKTPDALVGADGRHASTVFMRSATRQVMVP